MENFSVPKDLASNLNYTLVLLTDIFQKYHHCAYAACVKFTNTEVNAIYIDQQLTSITVFENSICI